MTSAFQPSACGCLRRVASPLLTAGRSRRRRRRTPCRPASGRTGWYEGQRKSSAACPSKLHQTSPAMCGIKLFHVSWSNELQKERFLHLICQPLAIRTWLFNKTNWVWSEWPTYQWTNVKPATTNEWEQSYFHNKQKGHLQLKIQAQFSFISTACSCNRNLQLIRFKWMTDPLLTLIAT